MSKLATFAVSVTMTGSDGSDAEGNQVDFGPYYTNVSGFYGANTISPATVSVVKTIANVATSVSVGPMAAANVVPIYLGIIPMAETTGPLTLSGSGLDVGVPISTSNPSFIPVRANVFNADGGVMPNGAATVFLTCPSVTSIKAAWI